MRSGCASWLRQTPSAAPVQISLGQTIDAVVSVLGAPTRIFDLGAKKDLHLSLDMKITFSNGMRA